MTTKERFKRFGRFERFERFALGVALALLATLPAQAQATRNFLWKASNQTGAIYLVGSVHLLSKDFYPLSPALDAAFKDSDLLVEEVNLDELLTPQAQALLLRTGMLPANQSLDTVVSPATFQLVAQRVAALGMPIEPLKRFKPWMLALTLDELEWEKAGFNADLGLDRHFHDRAKADGKAIQGLETTDFQLSLFDQMTPQQQERVLADSIKTIDTELANIRMLTNAWRTGDARTMERLVIDETKDDPEMFQRLLVNRNRAWIPKLEALFSRSGRTFVVVGAAHLVGSEGVLALLRAKGYRLEQL